MARRKYLKISEVIEICGVNVRFVARLEEEELIQPVLRGRQKLYPVGQVDRVRVARVLVRDMGVNLEGVDVALRMREQMIAMQRQFDRLLRSLASGMRKR